MKSPRKSSLQVKIERLKKKNERLKQEADGLRRERQLLRKGLKGMENMLKGTPIALLMVQDERIMFCSERIRQFLGYKAEEVLGRKGIDFVHPGDVEYVLGIYRQRLSGKALPNPYEIRLMTVEGESRPCEIWVEKTIYKRRRAFLLNIIDLVERKGKERQLVQTRKMDAIVRMSTGLSRVINECMNGLETLTGLSGLQESAGNPKLLKAIENASAARDKGHEIADKLFLLSGRSAEISEVIPCDLKKIVQDAISIIRPRLKDETSGSAISLKTYLRALSPVQARPEEIRAAFVDLISNAIEALKGSGRIYLSTEENSGFAHVYIQDNGEGIPASIQEKIFDPFYSTRDEGRMGLGLSLAYSIIGRYGGDIEIMSREKQGTTFTIKLPLAQKLSRPSAKTACHKMKGANILVVSAQGIILTLLNQVLLSKGAKIMVVSNEKEAVKAIRKDVASLVIADLSAPYGQISTLLKRLRKTKPDLPIVVIGDGNDDISQELRKMGPDLAIRRPLEMDKIIPKISRLIK